MMDNGWPVPQYGTIQIQTKFIAVIFISSAPLNSTVCLFATPGLQQINDNFINCIQVVISK